MQQATLVTANHMHPMDHAISNTVNIKTENIVTFLTFQISSFNNNYRDGVTLIKSYMFSAALFKNC